MVKKIAFCLLTLFLGNKTSAADHHKITMLPEEYLIERLNQSRSIGTRHLAATTLIPQKLGGKKLTQAELKRHIKQAADEYVNRINNPLLKSKTETLVQELETILVPRRAWEPR